MIYLPEYVIQIPMVAFTPFCMSSVQVYSKRDTDITGTRKVQETLPFKCPNMDHHTVMLEGGMSYEEADFKI